MGGGGGGRGASTRSGSLSNAAGDLNPSPVFSLEFLFFFFFTHPVLFVCRPAVNETSQWQIKHDYSCVPFSRKPKCRILHKATSSVKRLYLHQGAGDLFALSGAYWQIVRRNIAGNVQKTLKNPMEWRGVHSLTCNITKIVSNAFPIAVWHQRG